MPVIILTSDQPYNLKSLATQGSLPPGIPVDFGPVVFKAHVAGQKTLAGSSSTHTRATTYRPSNRSL